MTLKQLMRDIELEKVEGRLDVEIASPMFDWRKVEDGGLYVAVPGTQVDGHETAPMVTTARSRFEK